MNIKKSLVMIGFAAMVFNCFAETKPQPGLILHEWGTFTSLQAGDGIPLTWVANNTAELPDFVYNWSHPGLDRIGGGSLIFGKGRNLAMQRMETPVVYFYSPNEQTVDLTVKFPKGKITEWYPQAQDIGPTLTRARKETNSYVALINESLIHWPSFKVLPVAGNSGLSNALPQEKSGSHYFAARETDSDYLQLTGTNTETEKFLFYRGVGNFLTPLKVTMEASNVVTVENTSGADLRDLFVLNINKSAGQFFPIDRLQAHERKNIPLNSGKPVAAIQEAMAKALVAQGLYKKEASAMVHTWQDSWFAEQGIRVLYLLPRAWTDATLPMESKPQPTELVRVMVGRSELIPQRVERALSAELKKFKPDDKQSVERITQILKPLGRFSNATLQRALQRMPGNSADRSTLLAAVLSASKNN